MMTKARDQAFLRLIAREYFRVVGEANNLKLRLLTRLGEH